MQSFNKGFSKGIENFIKAVICDSSYKVESQAFLNTTYNSSLLSRLNLTLDSSAFVSLST